MTINELLERARANAEKKTYEFYLDVCDGNEEETAEFIEEEKEDGGYDVILQRETMDNIHSLIRAIKRTELMGEIEKEQAIAEIKKCKEYVESERRIAMMFANHFVKYQNVYLK